ncbi:hypothetical protein HCI96_05670 [Listeria seeligeri]|uniref:hypothetical protein n=1 Tax=Listeria seeligeri TaxID=1640 RepID=UPI001625906C|nr:hypothetical protein [Listeria seeligeri]MBC1826630.1 hypothetical protein [Listeria seeligeri]MBC1870160.1 hypothetical protein [Listeria seeligeri]MBM5598052.1 hypothetical protein [Listeria seeligeri]MBM5606490.1 hypothetical protein [Listeria seeligeri]MBM5611936.1 hypothetical protein [Listeria seeligeri]
MAADASEVTPKITIKESGKTALESGLTATPTNLIKNAQLVVDLDTKIYSDWDYYEITQATKRS